MKSSILLTLLAVLSGCSFSSGHEVADRNGEAETQLSELVDDIFLMIFPRLGLDDLVNLVEADARYLDVAGLEVQRRYRRHSMLYIQLNTNPRATEEKQEVYIHYTPIALKVLEFFGKYFQEICISTNFDNKNSEGVVITIEYLSKYCSKSLKKLFFEMKRELVLNEFTTPFEAVEELIIDARSATSCGEIQMNEIFPKLRKLKVLAHTRGSYPFINTQFSHLEHFALIPIYSDLTDYVDNDNIRGLILKNPNIRSIDTNVGDPHLLKFISQNWTNVEKLTIYDLGEEPLRFENLKNVKFLTGSRDIDSINKLSMPRLESLTMNYEDHSHWSNWLNFFKNHTQLRQLVVHTGKNFDADYNILHIRVDLFTADLPNLTEAEFETGIQAENVDSIIAFVENHRKLNRCGYGLITLNVEERYVLEERLGNEWNIDIQHGELKRKHPALD